MKFRSKKAIVVAYLFLTLRKWKWANVEMVKSPLFCDLNQWPMTFTFQCDLWLAEFESVERMMMVTGAIIGGELSPRNLSPFSCVLVIGRVLPGASFWPGGWERNLLVGVQSSLENDKEALVM